MELRLKRTDYTESSTIGDFYVDEKFFYFSLEDTVRPPGVKIPGKTAIPAGRYEVVTDWSNRFQRMMPHILDVPGFEGIRIHAGNAAKDTEGCPLLGMTKDKDFVGKSKAAFDDFYPKLVAGLGQGKVFIEIENKEV